MSKKLLAEFHRDKFATVQTCNRILIAHLDGAIVFPPPHSRERIFTRLLIDRELLTELKTGATQITELGRWALAEILALYADTILLAHRAAERPGNANLPREMRIYPVEMLAELTTVLAQK